MPKTVKEEAQTSMDEENLSDDADLVEAVNAWVKADAKRKALSAAAAAAKEAKERVVAMLLLDDEEHLYRVNAHVIHVKPPAEPKDASFTTTPRHSVRLTDDDEA